MTYLFRILLNILAFVQRLPLMVILGFIFIISFLLFKITRSLSLFLRGFRLCLRLYFGINGIWVRHTSILKELPPAIVIVHARSKAIYWLMYSLLPLAQFHILPGTFFKNIPSKSGDLSFFQRILFYLGFFPAESSQGLNYSQKRFFVEQYLDKYYIGVDYADFSGHENSPTPFLLMFAMKHKIPVYIIELKNSEMIPFASLCAPRILEVVLKGKIEPTRDEKAFVKQYRQFIK